MTGVKKFMFLWSIVFLMAVALALSFFFVMDARGQSLASVPLQKCETVAVMEYYYTDAICTSWDILDADPKIMGKGYNTTCQRLGFREINRSICNTVGADIEGRLFLWKEEGWECSITKESVTCDSCLDGDCNGICKSGESCITYDLNRSVRTESIDNDNIIPISIT